MQYNYTVKFTVLNLETNQSRNLSNKVFY